MLANGIAPRIQTFVNKRNIAQLPQVLRLIKNQEWEKRCGDIGREFSFFLHQGSCDGENRKLYDQWITREDIALIPEELEEMTLRYFGKGSMKEVLGQTEEELYDWFLDDFSTGDIVSEEPVFFIDSRFNVYPNYESPSPLWMLGNLKEDGAERVLECYAEKRSPAQHVLASVPACELAKSCGHPHSHKLFGKWDYKNFLLEEYCRRLYIEN